MIASVVLGILLLLRTYARFNTRLQLLNNMHCITRHLWRWMVHVDRGGRVETEQATGG